MLQSQEWSYSIPYIQQVIASSKKKLQVPQTASIHFSNRYINVYIIFFTFIHLKCSNVNTRNNMFLRNTKIL